MADVLIRDIPDEVIAAIDAKAQRAGLSRTEYLRRALARENIALAPVTPADLDRLAAAAEDLAAQEVMRRAWS